MLEKNIVRVCVPHPLFFPELKALRRPSSRSGCSISTLGTEEVFFLGGSSSERHPVVGCGRGGRHRRLHSRGRGSRGEDAGLDEQEAGNILKLR